MRTIFVTKLHYILLLFVYAKFCYFRLLIHFWAALQLQIAGLCAMLYENHSWRPALPVQCLSRVVPRRKYRANRELELDNKRPQPCPRNLILTARIWLKIKVIVTSNLVLRMNK